MKWALEYIGLPGFSMSQMPPTSLCRSYQSNGTPSAASARAISRPAGPAPTTQYRRW